MARQVVNTQALLALNPEYAEALAKGEPWALKHAEMCRSLNAGEPEGMRRQFTGEYKRWCGAACPNEEGCITCTLPDNPEAARDNRRYKRWKNKR